MDEDGDEGDDASSSDAETSDNGGVTTSGWCGGDGSIGNSNRQKKTRELHKDGHWPLLIYDHNQEWARPRNDETLLGTKQGILTADCSGLPRLGQSQRTRSLALGWVRGRWHVFLPLHAAAVIKKNNKK